MNRDWFEESARASILVDDSGKEWIELEHVPSAVPVTILRKVLDDYYRSSPGNRSLGICKTLEHLLDEATDSNQG